MEAKNISWKNCKENGEIWEKAVEQTFIDKLGSAVTVKCPQDLGYKGKCEKFDRHITFNGKTTLVECKCEEDYTINICIEWWRVKDGKHVPNGLQLSGADVGIHALDKGRVVVAYDMQEMQRIVALRDNMERKCSGCQGKDFTKCKNWEDCKNTECRHSKLLFTLHETFAKSDASTGGYIAPYKYIAEPQKYAYMLNTKLDWIKVTTLEKLPECTLFKGNQK
jgi:hypothetical protein